MTDNFIKLNKSDVLTLGIKTNDGKDTGEFLEFDLEDIELPLKYQELLEKDKKNKERLRNQILIIDKRQDVKGKKLMSKNEEDKLKALNDFFNITTMDQVYTRTNIGDVVTIENPVSSLVKSNIDSNNISLTLV